MGTGDVDCIYRFTLPKLIDAVREYSSERDQELLDIMVAGHRLKDVADLLLELAI